MSWHSELLPPRLSVSNLIHELAKAHSEYRAANLPASTRVVFMLLRVIQRMAYNAGWAAGKR